MTIRTQGLVAAALAAVLIRISWTGEYLRFVQPWMRWPLLVTGIALLGVAMRPALGWVTEGHPVPRTSWLLLLPTLVMFTVAPPPLGAFIAERRVAQDPASLPPPVVVKAPADGSPADLAVDEFTWGASQPDDPMGLKDQPVRLTGFVSKDADGAWYVTTLVIFCCAADVAVERVKVVGEPSPPRDQWVQVTGTWVEGTGRDPSDPARLTGTDLVKIPTPRDPYS